MTPIHEKVLKLIENELSFLIDNPHELPDIADFFYKGGFSNWNVEQIDALYYDLFK